MNPVPKPRRFALPVAGARIGSRARPVADGAAVVVPAPAKRLGLRANTRGLASIAMRADKDDVEPASGAR